VTFRLI